MYGGGREKKTKSSKRDKHAAAWGPEEASLAAPSSKRDFFLKSNEGEPKHKGKHKSKQDERFFERSSDCLLYTSPSPRDS